MRSGSFSLRAIGAVRSALTRLEAAPLQGDEGAPGLHRVTVLEVAGPKLRVAPIEALDGTPIVDIKPVLRSLGER